MEAATFSDIKFLYLFGEGNFVFVREISGNFWKLVSMATTVQCKHHQHAQLGLINYAHNYKPFSSQDGKASYDVIENDPSPVSVNKSVPQYG